MFVDLIRWSQNWYLSFKIRALLPMPWFLKNNLHTSDYYPSQKNSWMRFTSWLPGVLGLTIIFFTACRPKGHSIETVEQAMKKYDRYILHMDVDSISLL